MQRRSWELCVGSATVLLCGAMAMHPLRVSTAVSAAENTPAFVNWSAYGGSNSDSQYTALTQINKANVGQLQQVWFYPSGYNGYRYGSYPIVIDGVMSVIGKDNNVAAVNAATGKEIWMHDNQRPRVMMHRGLMYWESKDRGDRRVLYTMNSQLRAIDARTGADIATFGDQGAVDLRVGLRATAGDGPRCWKRDPGAGSSNIW